MRRAAILGILALIGCVTTTVTGAGAKVRVTSNPESVRGCKPLGNVKGSDHWNGGTMGQGFAEESATNELRNNTAAMGGNTVLMVRSTTNTSGSTQLGEAYSCPAEPAPAVTPATK
jgi:hypothetical protein